MTRETRIGLLVGFAFIVAFGLVLSELTGTGKPPSPAVASTDNVAPESWSPVIELNVAPSPPAEPVATREAAPSPEPATVAVSLEPSQDLPVGAVVRAEVLPRSAETPATATSEPAPAPAARTYVVRAGDSLIKIARTVYGAGREREYKRIYEANKNLMPDEATVIVGQELTIPPLPGAAPTPAPVRPATTVVEAPRPYREVTLETVARELADATTRRAAPQRTYTIRRGDNLTKIARETLGDDSRQTIQKLYNANKDKLRSPDSLPVGVTLEIPQQS
ncbi:MAG TPA: hypothetical protein DCX07_10215 [Phycisphaerales bacterium]|nr:hypothetical protein [Phycisphaerales bacterium]